MTAEEFKINFYKDLEIVAAIIGLMMSIAWLPLGFAMLAKYILWVLVFLILYKIIKYVYKD